MAIERDWSTSGFWFYAQHPGVMLLKLEKVTFGGFSMPKWWPREILWKLFVKVSILSVWAVVFFGLLYAWVTTFPISAISEEAKGTFQALSAVMGMCIMVAASGAAILCEKLSEVWTQRHQKIYIIDMGCKRARLYIQPEPPVGMEHKILFKASLHAFFGKRSGYNGWKFYSENLIELKVVDGERCLLKFSTLFLDESEMLLLFALSESLVPDGPHSVLWRTVLRIITPDDLKKRPAAASRR